MDWTQDKTVPELAAKVEALLAGPQDLRLKRFLESAGFRKIGGRWYSVKQLRGEKKFAIVEPVYGEYWSRILPLWLEYQEQLKGDGKDDTENKV